MINPNWLDNRNYLINKQREIAQFNREVEAFKANPASIYDFERLLETHPNLPLGVTYSAWGAQIPAGSRDLFDIEDELTKERIKKEQALHKEIYDRYAPEDLARNMQMNVSDFFSFGLFPGGAGPGDIQYGVWGVLGLEWLMQTLGPSGKVNLPGIALNALLPGKPFTQGRAIEYYGAVKQAQDYMEQGMSISQAQDRLMIDISDSDVLATGKGSALVEAFKMSGQTNLGALWNEVWSNGFLPNKYTDKPVNFDRSTLIGFQPVIPEQTELYRYYKQAGYSDEESYSKTVSVIGEPLKRKDENGDIFYTSIARPNKINFYAGRYTRNRKYSLNPDNNHPAWAADNTLLEYSPGKVHASEYYKPGTLSFNLLSGSIDVAHQLADPLLYSKWLKVGNLGKRWNQVNRASEFLDNGILLQQGKKVKVNTTKIIENTYEDLGKLEELGKEGTQNFSRFKRLFGQGYLSEAKAVRATNKKAKQMRNQLLVFNKVNKYFAPSTDVVFDMPVWNNIFQLVAESGPENLYAMSRMPLFRHIHPDLLAEMLFMNKADEVKDFFKVYANTGRKVVNSKAGLKKNKKAPVKEVIEKLSDNAMGEVGQSGFINNLLINLANDAKAFAESSNSVKRMLSKPMARFGNQDAAYRNLGSYIGQGARGIVKTAGDISPFKTSKNIKTIAPTVESLSFDKAEEVGKIKLALNKVKENFTSYDEYEIQKYLGFGGAYKTYNEPYLNGLLSLVPDSGLVITNKKRAYQNLLKHMEVNNYNEKEASEWLLKFVNLDYTKKTSIYKFGKDFREWEVDRAEKLLGPEFGPEKVAPLRNYLKHLNSRLERSKIYANAKTKNIPGFNSNFEVQEVVLAEDSRDVGKFKNVGTLNALFLSQMTDSVVPLIPWQYIQRVVSGAWNVVPDSGLGTQATILAQDIKGFAKYVSSWGKEGYIFPNGFLPRKSATDADVVNRAMDFYTRKIFKPLVLLRVAFLTRVFFEEQARILVKGLDNFFTNPIIYTQWLSTGKKMSNKKLLDMGFTQAEIDDIPDIQSVLMSQELLEGTQQTIGLTGFLGKKAGWNPLNVEYRMELKSNVSNAEYSQSKLWDYVQVRTDPIGRKVAKYGWGSPELNKWLDSSEGQFWLQEYADYSGNYDILTDSWALDQLIQQQEAYIREITGDNIVEGIHFMKQAGSDVKYQMTLDKVKEGNKGSTILRNIISEGKIPVVKDGKVTNKFVDFMSDIDGYTGITGRIKQNNKKALDVKNWEKRSYIKAMSNKQKGKAINAAKELFKSTTDGGLGLNGGYVRVTEELDDANKTSRYEDIIDGLFEVLMRKPIGYLNRAPVFKQFYWLWVMDNINQMDKSLQKKYINNAKAYGVPSQVVNDLITKSRLGTGSWSNFNEVEPMNRAYALENLKDLLYDTTTQHKISEVTRNIFPFPEIWFEVFKTWGKLLANNPYPVVGVQKGRRALQGTNDVSDTNTGWFAPHPMNPSDDVFMTPFEAWMGPLLVEGDDDESNMKVQYKSTLSSINLLAQSQVPGTNSIVALGLNKVLPSRGVFGEFKNWLTQFPMPEEIALSDLASLAPTYKKLGAFLQGVDVDFSREWGDKVGVFEFSEDIVREPGEALSELETLRADSTINFWRHAMVSLEWVNIYKDGRLDKYFKYNIPNWKDGDDVTYEQIEDAMLDYARDRAQVDMFMQFIRSFIGPSSNYKPEYFIKAKNSLHYHMAVLYEVYEEILENNNYDTIQTSQDFHSKFGLDHMYLFSPTDIKVSGKGVKTYDAVDFWNSHPREKKLLPLSFQFLYGDNPEAKMTWQAINNERYDLTPDEYRRYINKTKGFYQYQSWKDDIKTMNNILQNDNLELTGGGEDDLAAIMRNAIMADFSGFQRDEYGFITLTQIEDIWREITEIWPNLDLTKTTEEGKFFLELYPIMQEYDEKSSKYLISQDKEVKFDWWKKSDEPQAQYFRMQFDTQAKELLAKYPRGFNLYYNVVLRLLNPDRAAYDFVDLSDDEIDIIRNDS